MSLSIRRDYCQDPSLLARVMDLLGIVFPFVPDQLREGSKIGLRWERASAPFVVTDGDPEGRVLAHVGALELPLVVEGKAVRVAAVHAVATHPDHRRRGLYRRTMEAALEYVDELYETAVLSTDRPEIYVPFGFRELAEWRFVGPAPPPLRREESRTLDYAAPEDVERLHDLLADRTPVSRRFGLVGESAVFLFNQAKAPPTYVPALDALLVYEVKERVLRLYDVVARKMPTLEAIVGSIPEEIGQVEVYFAAQALGGDLQPERHVLDGDDRMCVRGPLACEDVPFMWPRPSRC